ncbi:MULTISPECIES: hypothetical protein [Leptolyngbya]|uniref:Uncharacterized protein n=1 Tax=Leptolyngbya boryana CZ1 TaxID=3060204 RepID=A0AA96WUV4_LEPBY|nr:MULTISPECIES: hypothetical protein [Leptolyngbya]MBN8559503.1 hypothetical protein [Leptolyngbya sp. UWPOB_LEPTO1]MCY6491889.1 hypothetical protein [Leptolyngbya sp. GGD]WNZ44699.1 hypothetical protein Q2T42_23180 [Leptolyngbya boryana CZ1]
MQDHTSLDLEQELSRLACAFATRNTEIGKAVIANLRSRLTLRDVAGMVIVSLERLVWIDPLAFCWAIENVIPGYVMREIRRITSVTLYRRLITQGYEPGHDFSMDGKGQVLLNAQAKSAMFAG